MNSIVTVFLFLDTSPLWEARQRNCGLAYASINAVLDLVVPQNLRLEFMKESVPWTPDLQQHNIALFANVVDGFQSTLHVSSCRNVFLENEWPSEGYLPEGWTHISSVENEFRKLFAAQLHRLLELTIGCDIGRRSPVNIHSSNSGSQPCAIAEGLASLSHSISIRDTFRVTYHGSPP